MTEGPKSRWTEDDLALLRTLGGRLSQIIQGEEVDVPDLQRRDELGILANMVSRLARDLQATRRRQLTHERELERRVEELQAAYDTHEKLLTAIRSLSSPVLEPHDGILLVPLASPFDAAGLRDDLRTLREHVAARHPDAVILHVAAAEPLPPDACARLLRAGQSLGHLGARAILSGVSSAARADGIDLGPLAPCATLGEALLTALDLVGYRITR